MYPSQWDFSDACLSGSCLQLNIAAVQLQTLQQPLLPTIMYTLAQKKQTNTLNSDASSILVLKVFI